MIPVCPKCDVGLLILNFKEVEIDFCQKCRGIWLDAGELEALMEQTGAAQEDPLMQLQLQDGFAQAGRPHLCPRCDQSLRQILIGRTNAASVTLDRCPRGHGLWFDRDELAQILKMFPPESGAAKTIGYLNELFGFTPKP